MNYAPGDWYPDPFGRYQYRYWDSNQWTAHVATGGQQWVDAPVPSLPGTSASAVRRVPDPAAPRKAEVAGGGLNSRVTRVVQKAQVADGQVGGGTLYTEPVLVVNQKAKFVEINAEYSVFDQHGQQVGSVREVGQGMVRNALSVRPAENRTRRLQILDSEDRVLMTLTKPAQFIRSTVVVRDAGGAEIGQIVQKTVGVIKRIRFDLLASGKHIGTINGEDRSDWDFNVVDTNGSEAARISRTLKSLTNRRFAKTDTYVVQIPRPSPEPLRSLVIASALVVDTVLRQGASDARRGRGNSSRRR